jgi:hypothetical protein
VERRDQCMPGMALPRPMRNSPPLSASF